MLWGVEGAWNYGRGLAQCLVAHDETVYEINPRWTAKQRRRARKPGKSDPLDAHAVATLVHEEATTLPPVTAEDETAVLDLLVTEREAALAEATRLRNQLHQLLLQVDPAYTTHLPPLRSAAGVRAAARLAPRAATCSCSTASRRFGAWRSACSWCWTRRTALEQQILRARGTPRYAPLTRLHGVQLLTAGALAGILGPGRRFRSEAQLAAYAGAAPLEASSAGCVRHRLNRGGNRRLNAMLYRIALTQAHSWPPAQAYLARRQAEGKTRREAFRALKRYLVRAIWRLWQACLQAPAGQVSAQAA